MTGWKKTVIPLIQQAKKVVILGIGNDLMADDGAGSRIADELRTFLLPQKTAKALTIINASTAPENYTGVIRRQSPDLILMIDSVDAGKQAGAVTFRDPKKMRSPMPSSHALPLSSLAEYLESTTRARVIGLGIQAKRIHFGSPLSDEVSSSVREVVEVLGEALRTL